MQSKIIEFPSPSLVSTNITKPIPEFINLLTPEKQNDINDYYQIKVIPNPKQKEEAIRLTNHFKCTTFNRIRYLNNTTVTKMELCNRLNNVLQTSKIRSIGQISTNI